MIWVEFKWFHILSNKYILPCLSKMNALHQNVRIRWQCSPWGGGYFLKMYKWVECVWPQDNFIIPAPPVRGLPTYHDWSDRMKLVCNSTILIILPSGKNISADTVLIKIGRHSLRLKLWLSFLIPYFHSVTGFLQIEETRNYMLCNCNI